MRRLLKLKNKVWLAAYTVSHNKGYKANPAGVVTSVKRDTSGHHIQMRIGKIALRK